MYLGPWVVPSPCPPGGVCAAGLFSYPGRAGGISLPPWPRPPYPAMLQSPSYFGPPPLVDLALAVSASAGAHGALGAPKCPQTQFFAFYDDPCGLVQWFWAF